MTSIERLVIVGAGLAGARAAASLRTEGHEGGLTLRSVARPARSVVEDAALVDPAIALEDLAER